jgi:succinoglycan biosynthesis transport protein ExoP
MRTHEPPFRAELGLPASSASDLSTSLSRRDLAYFVFKRKQQIAAVLGTTVALVTIGTYVVPRVYEATTTIYVARNLPAIAATTVSRAGMILDRKEVLESEVDLITSRAVAEKVADTLLDQQGTPRTPPAFVRLARAAAQQFRSALIAIGLADPPPAPKEGFIAGVLSMISAKPAVNSGFITISARAESPQYAATVANTVTKTYVAQRLILFNRPGLEEFYSEQIARARKELDSLEGQTQTLKDKTGLLSIDDQLRLKLEELSGLHIDLNGQRNLTQELRERIAALRSRVQSEPDTVTASRLMARNPTIDDLERKRFDLAAQRALDLNRFQASSPPIEELDRGMERIQASIAEQPATILNSESLTQNTVRTTLQTDLYRAESDYAAKVARERTVLEQIARLNEEIYKLDSDAADLRRLNLASTTAAKIYNTYVEEREAARIAKQTDSGVTNVQVVSWAVPPTRPKYPRMMLIGVGGFLGLFLGFVLAFVSELFSQTLDRREDVERHLDLPVLAVVPDMPALRDPGERRIRAPLGVGLR